MARTGFALKLAASGAAAALLLPFSVPLAQGLFGRRDLWHLVPLTCTAAAGMLMYRSLLLHWQAHQRFGRYAAYDLQHTVLRFGSIGLILLLGAASVHAVVLLTAVAPLAMVALAGVRDRLPPISMRIERGPAQRIVHTARWFLLTYGVANLVNRFDLYLLTQLSGLAQAGLYAAAQTFALVPELLGNYLSVVVSPRLLRLWSAGTLPSLLRRLMVLGTVASALIYAAAWLLLTRTDLFPAGFQPSARLLLVLLPGALAGMIALAVPVPFLMFARPRFIFTVDMFTLPLVVALFAWLTARHGALGAAIAASISRCAKTSVLVAAAWHLARGRAVGAAAP